MILALDIGNSQLYGGVLEEGRLVLSFRKTSGVRASSDEYGLFLRGVLRENGVEPAIITGITACSVVPDVVHSIRNAGRKYFSCETFFLQPGVKTGLKIKYRNPLEVGADKIANALGASRRYPDTDLIVVDFGTATTLCAISRDREYLGGVITPGVQTSMELLDAKTAKLPAVEIVRPKDVLGRSTVESIQAGLYFGAFATVIWMRDALIREQFLGRKVLTLATGGFGRLFEDERIFDAYVPELALEGLYAMFEMNRGVVR